jgi:hypothetical protein
MLKSRAIYYARLPGGYLPQRAQTLMMVDAAFARIRANKAVTGTVLFDIFNPHDSRGEVIVTPAYDKKSGKMRSDINAISGNNRVSRDAQVLSSDLPLSGAMKATVKILMPSALAVSHWLRTVLSSAGFQLALLPVISPSVISTM